MIVRNEAKMLPAFLSATQGLYDELVVVDTGSDDATLDLLKDAGAKVVHHSWQDDYAQARNAGLDAAGGEWILYLDADERPNADFITSVRHLCRQADVGAASLTLRHHLGDDQTSITYPLRLFRAETHARFSHPICEDIVGAVLGALDASGKRLARLQGEVEHLGFAPEQMGEADKQAHVQERLRALVDAHPEDFYSWYKLLDQARFWGDIGALTDAAYEAEANLTARPDEQSFEAWYMGELLVLMAEGMYAGDDVQLLRFLLPWQARISPSAAYFLRRGELYESTGNLEEAQVDFLRCVDLRQMTPNTQLATVRPLLGLSRLSMLRGDNATALELVDVALTESPRDPEALLALTTLTRALGGAQTTARVVEAYIESHGDTTELRAALGEAALRAGDATGAIRELEQATTMAPGGRAKALLEQARSAAAETQAP